MEWASFVINAYIVAILSSVLCGLTGYYIVMRNETFLLHALSHISLPGVILTNILGFSPYLGQLGCVFLFCIFLVYYKDMSQDAPVGIFLAFTAGLSNLLVSKYASSQKQVASFFFGDIFCISYNALWWHIGLTILAIVFFIGIHSQLLFISLEKELAASQSIHVKRISLIFYFILSITIVMASNIIGSLLLFCLLITPTMVTIHWARTTQQGIALSILITALLTIIGLSISLLIDCPVTFIIGALSVLLFILSQYYTQSYQNL